MINKEGLLTYSLQPNPLVTWRPESDLLNEILIAALLTILSYQLAAIVLDLFLGLKHKGHASLRDIHIQLLAGNSSIRSVIRALFPRTYVAFRNKRKYSAELRDDYEEEHFGFVTILKLFSLLFFIPFINMMTIVLSLERTVERSVEETQFGGLVFGINFNQTITHWEPLSTDCITTPLLTYRQEFSNLEFNLCIFNAFNQRKVVPQYSNISRYQHLEIRINGINQFIATTVSVSEWISMNAKYGAILTRTGSSENSPEVQTKNLYHLQQDMTEASSRQLAMLGYEVAKGWCGNHLPFQEKFESDPRHGLQYSLIVRCEPAQSNLTLDAYEKAANAVSNEMLPYITFQENSKLNLILAGTPSGTGRRVDGKNLKLLTRRVSLISIPILGIIVGGVLVVRYFLSFILSNDLGQGIALIVRDGLGLPCCDSMLNCHDVTASFDPNVCELRGVD